MRFSAKKIFLKLSITSFLSSNNFSAVIKVKDAKCGLNSDSVCEIKKYFNTMFKSFITDPIKISDRSPA
jgi:hypothetical protein